MTKEIVMMIVSFVVTGSLGYCVNVIKNYKNKIKEDKENQEKQDNLQNMALLTLLRTNLMHTYFVYNELKQIPDYAYQNFLESLKVYESLGGDGFIHTIAKKMENWDITKTDIMK